MNTNNQENNILKSYNMLLYFAGSMILYEPREECITDFWGKGILKNLPVSSSNPNFIRAASQLRNSCTDLKTCSKTLIEDYTRLFGRQELPLALAHESLYKGNSHLDQNNTPLKVTGFYESYGWKPKFRRKVKNDHLGIELLFLTMLVDKYLILDDNACLIEMRKEIRRFINDHLLSWILYWNKDIQKHAKTLCYKGIGSLILSCIEDIDSIFEQKLAISFQNDNIKN